MGGQLCCAADEQKNTVALVDAIPAASDDAQDSHQDQVVSGGVKGNEEPQKRRPQKEEDEKERKQMTAKVEGSYEITLDRSGGKLGMLVYNQPGEDFLRVRSVREGWIVDKWNSSHPSKQVMPGYIIIAVNGKTKADEMCFVIGDVTHKSLNLTVWPNHTLA